MQGFRDVFDITCIGSIQNQNNSSNFSEVPIIHVHIRGKGNHLKKLQTDNRSQFFQLWTTKVSSITLSEGPSLQGEKEGRGSGKAVTWHFMLNNLCS